MRLRGVREGRGRGEKSEMRLRGVREGREEGCERSEMRVVGEVEGGEEGVKGGEGRGGRGIMHVVHSYYNTGREVSREE